MADSESGIGDVGNMETGTWPATIVRDADWPEVDGDVLGRIDFHAPLDASGEGLKEFFGDIQHDADQVYLDNVPDETITTFHHEGKTRTLNKQELIDLLWGFERELADDVPEWSDVKLNAFEFNITVRLMNRFRAAGLFKKTIGELFDYMREVDERHQKEYGHKPGWETLLNFRNLGRVSLLDLIRALLEIGVPRDVLTAFQNFPVSRLD